MLRLSRVTLVMLLLLFAHGLSSFTSGEKRTVLRSGFRWDGLNNVMLYSTLQLKESGLPYEAFLLGLKGMERLTESGRLVKADIISIVDLSQSSNKKRLYIIDLKNKEVILQTYVAHGRNSGEEFARTFSNQPSSYMTSLGFYRTGDLYTGEHGLSMRLYGEESGINHNAFERAIVMHGANYVKEDFIAQNGRLGRSQGCPAVPVEQSDEIVNLLKSGTCLFLYYPDKQYLAASELLK